MGGIRIEGQKIIHMRGDSALLAIDLWLNGKPYEMQEGDSAVLTVKKNIKASDFLFQKTMEDGAFYIVPADTINLKAPASYIYDVQMTLADGQVYTVAGPATYRLLCDVTTEVQS